MSPKSRSKSTCDLANETDYRYHYMKVLREAPKRVSVLQRRTKTSRRSVTHLSAKFEGHEPNNHARELQATY